MTDVIKVVRVVLKPDYRTTDDVREVIETGHMKGVNHLHAVKFGVIVGSLTSDLIEAVKALEQVQSVTLDGGQ
jgi:predicted transcriptional regulator